MDLFKLMSQQALQRKGTPLLKAMDAKHNSKFEALHHQ
jgi:hypothetical protein